MAKKVDPEGALWGRWPATRVKYEGRYKDAYVKPGGVFEHKGKLYVDVYMADGIPGHTCIPVKDLHPERYTGDQPRPPVEVWLAYDKRR